MIQIFFRFILSTLNVHLQFFLSVDDVPTYSPRN